MAIWMLDTCTVIDFMKGRTPLGLKILQESDAALIKIPAIVEAELWVGVEKCQDHLKASCQLERFLEPFETLGFDSICAGVYGRIRAELERQGKPIGGNDTLIAAMALAYDATLVTHNSKEFARVPGLRVETWYEGDRLNDLLA